jgi:4-hydroxy-tetrahydrodipicolinate synthase
MEFRGSFVALATPFDRKGRLDKKTLERLVEWQIREGTDGIVCSATTGEGPCLSDPERKNIAEICIRVAGGRVPIIVATGINDTRQSVRYTENALKLGAAACLVVTPYYNRPTQLGCILHFREVAKVGLPVIVYHNPPRTSIRLTIETVIELSRIPNIAAIKDSGHEIEFVRKAKEYLPILSGDDDFTFEILKAGGAGAITVSQNFIPRGCKQMIQYSLRGEWEKAERLAERYFWLYKALFLETNPQGVKFVLSWLGRCEPVLRLPMTLPSLATQAAIKKELLALSLPQFNLQRLHV